MELLRKNQKMMKMKMNLCWCMLCFSLCSVLVLLQPEMVESQPMVDIGVTVGRLVRVRARIGVRLGLDQQKNLAAQTLSPSSASSAAAAAVSAESESNQTKSPHPTMADAHNPDMKGVRP